MRRRLILAELSLLALGAAAVGAQAAGQGGSGADQVVLPLGLPLTTWVAILGISGSGAIVGSGIKDVFKSGVAVIKTYSADYPARLKREADKEGAETLTKQQEAKFAEIVNEALKDREATILTLQANMTGMLGNSTAQAVLITQVQQAMLDQHTSHTHEMEVVNGRLNDLSLKLELKDTQLAAALLAADDWKKKYEDEAALRMERDNELRAAQKEIQRLTDLVTKATGEGIAVGVDEMPSSSSIPGIPLN